MIEPICCYSCGDEATETSEEEAALSGWGFGEYGPVCPECVGGLREPVGALADIAEAFGITKKDAE